MTIVEVIEQLSSCSRPWPSAFVSNQTCCLIESDSIWVGNSRLRDLVDSVLDWPDHIGYLLVVRWALWRILDGLVRECRLHDGS